MAVVLKLAADQEKELELNVSPESREKVGGYVGKNLRRICAACAEPLDACQYLIVDKIMGGETDVRGYDSVNDRVGKWGFILLDQGKKVYGELDICCSREYQSSDWRCGSCSGGRKIVFD